MKGHPDISLVDFLQFGFPIGFDSNHTLQSTDQNHASSLNYPAHVQAYLKKEADEHSMLGPFPAKPFWPWCHINPVMTRPKKNSDDRRVILDLSWPLHASVNGGTELSTYFGEPYKLLLPTVDDIAQIIAFYGHHTYLWSLDLQRAFRQLRIDPLDWPMIGISWDQQFYVDVAVAFGLRHGSAFCQRVSQAVCDILNCENITAVPYIDDTIGAQPTLALAQAGYSRAVKLFAELGLTLNTNKCTPPSTTITWVGVLFDTVSMTMQIPPSVLQELSLLVNQWLHKLSATRHELQVLLGKLFHAGKCSAPARIFVGRMLDTLRNTPPTGVTQCV
jgi:hypothetical protein